MNYYQEHQLSLTTRYRVYYIQICANKVTPSQYPFKSTIADEKFLNDCAVPLPTTGKADQNFSHNFRIHEANYFHRSCVYLIFDRYNDESIKETTHVNHQRTVSVSLIFSVRPTGQLQSVMLGSLCPETRKD